MFSIHHWYIFNKYSLYFHFKFPQKTSSSPWVHPSILLMVVKSLWDVSIQPKVVNLQPPSKVVSRFFRHPIPMGLPAFLIMSDLKKSCQFWCSILRHQVASKATSSTPWKINGWTISSWRFGSDHFPFFSWVMAVGSSRYIFQGFFPLKKNCSRLWWLKEPNPSEKILVNKNWKSLPRVWGEHLKHDWNHQLEKTSMKLYISYILFVNSNHRKIYISLRWNMSKC